MDYIFGYGSIINDASRIATSSSCHNISLDQKDKPSSADDRGDGDDSDISGGQLDLAVAAQLCPQFAQRVWNFRCPTGFTALGIVLGQGDECSGEGNKTIQKNKADESHGINGVLFPVMSHQDLTAFDIREVGYTRISVPLNRIKILCQLGCSTAQARAEKLHSKLTSTINIDKSSEDIEQTLPRIWIYVPDASHTASPSVEYPILQTYVDVCVEGCLQWGGKSFAIDFLLGTSNWSEYYLNDTPMSRRPWLHRKDYRRVDDCLKSVSNKIQFSYRKHPDEFASLHLTSLKGMFGVPPRNRTFIGREDFLHSVHQRLSHGKMSDPVDEDTEASIELPLQSSSDELNPVDQLNNHSNTLKQVEISGIGGVGKSQIVIEYAHRYYSSSCYALVAWFRAESAASIAADMRKLAFDMGIIQVGHRSSSQQLPEDELDNAGGKSGHERGLSVMTDDERMDTEKDLEEYDDAYIINELMRRLGLCRFKYLFIFDNLEDPSILPAYLPRVGGEGVGCGHVLVTSRVQHYDWMLRGSSLTLDCFNTFDSVKYLQQTLGILFSQNYKNIENDNNDDNDNDDAVLTQLSLRMGNLPLALSIAVAYMVRCDVNPREYLAHVNHSSGGNMDAIATSLNVTLKRIGEESKSAASVLPSLGYFAPDNISKDMIQLFLLSAHYNEEGPQPEIQQVINDSSLLLIDCEKEHTDDQTSDSEKNTYRLDTVEVKPMFTSVVMASIVWAAFLTQCYNKFVGFTTGIITGCLVSLNFVGVFFWLFPRYRICVENKACDNSIGSVAEHGKSSPPSQQFPSIISTSTKEVITRVSSADVFSHRLACCISMIDDRQACQISSNVTTELDKIWEIMKQFSLISIRGGKGYGCVHRLQQAVLRAAHEEQADISENSTPQRSRLEGLVQKGLCLERCIWVLSKLWKFDKNDSFSWQKTGDIIEHIQTIAKHATDMIPQETRDDNNIYNEKTSKRSFIRIEYYLLLSVLLKEGGIYISMVLSRFDSAQQLLEWAHHIQTYLLQTIHKSSTSMTSSLENNFNILLVEKINDCLASTLYILGKVLRYNDQLAESEFMLKQSLELRKRENDAAVSSPRDVKTKLTHNHGASADVLHELGVLHLRKHDLYTAKSFLTRSLHMKYEYAEDVQETDASSTLHQLGVVATLERRYDDAESLLLQALDLQHHDIAEIHNDDTTDSSNNGNGHGRNLKKQSAGNMTSRAATLQQLGRVELRRGRIGKADKFLTEALEMYTVAYGESRAASHVNVAGVRHQLGAAAMAAKQYDKACEHFAVALAAREIICSQSSGGKDHVTSELLSLGQAEVERGQYTSAETLFLRAKCSLEIDLCDTVAGSESYDLLSKKGKGGDNYSSVMLSKCGYGTNNHETIEDIHSLERKRNSLIKQLFFCVHLLRGVARHRNDTQLTIKYSLELKGLSKKYPSHRHVQKLTNQNQNKTSTPTIQTNKNIPADNQTVNVFQSDCELLSISEEKNTSRCRSELFLEKSTIDGFDSQLDTDLLAVIPRLVLVRCNIRQHCKAIQKNKHKKQHLENEYSILCESLHVVRQNLSSETNSLLNTTHDRIHSIVQEFSAKVYTMTSSSSLCSKKAYLVLMYQLSDDLRNAIRSYGYRLEDL